MNFPHEFILSIEDSLSEFSIKKISHRIAFVPKLKKIYLVVITIKLFY